MKIRKKIKTFSKKIFSGFVLENIVLCCCFWAKFRDITKSRIKKFPGLISDVLGRGVVPPRRPFQLLAALKYIHLKLAFLLSNKQNINYLRLRIKLPKYINKTRNRARRIDYAFCNAPVPRWKRCKKMLLYGHGLSLRKRGLKSFDVGDLLYFSSDTFSGTYNLFHQLIVSELRSRFLASGSWLHTLRHHGHRHHVIGPYSHLTARRGGRFDVIPPVASEHPSFTLARLQELAASR